MMPSDRVVTCCGARACQHVQLSHCQCYYSGDACCWCRTDPSKGVSVGTVAPAAHAGVESARRACSQCGHVGALEVHHVVSISDDPARAFDASNLRLLCRRCHRAVTPTRPPGPRAALRELAREAARRALGSHGVISPTSAAPPR